MTTELDLLIQAAYAIGATRPKMQHVDIICHIT